MQVAVGPSSCLLVTCSTAALKQLIGLNWEELGDPTSSSKSERLFTVCSDLLNSNRNQTHVLDPGLSPMVKSLVSTPSSAIVV